MGAIHSEIDVLASPAPQFTIAPIVQDSWRSIRFDKSVVICRQGDPADVVFVLAKGLVKLTRRLDDGREVLLRLVRNGELFADQSIFGDAVHDCAAETVTTAIIYTIPARDFLEQCRQRPEVWNWVANQMQKRFRDVQRRLELVAFHRVEHRVLHLVADLAEAFVDPADGARTNIPLAQSEIANLIGATRETASTILNQLARRGLIVLGRRAIQVPDPAAVREAAMEPEPKLLAESPVGAA
jgi:CRP/FNR family transcriptional regulator